MRNNLIHAKSMLRPAILLVLATVFLGSMTAPGSHAAEEELSLRELLENESDDAPTTDSQLDLGDDEADERDDPDEEDKDEAFEVAKSKRAAIDSAMARLRKPLHQVRVIGSLGNPNSPTDAGSQLASGDQAMDQASTLIAGSGSSIPIFQRQTVCFSHRPLYLEDENLERCGNGRGYLTNAFSALHFVSSVAVLPYKMAKQPPNCPVHAGGDCRCGQSKPVDLDLFPIDLHAAAVQTATVAGFSFLLL